MSTTTSAITLASTGRSMKKREITPARPGGGVLRARFRRAHFGAGIGGAGAARRAGAADASVVRCGSTFAPGKAR